MEARKPTSTQTSTAALSVLFILASSLLSEPVRGFSIASRVSLVPNTRSACTTVGSCRSTIVTRLGASIAVEQDSSDTLEDDENETSPELLNGAYASKQNRNNNSKKNSAMRDPQFLRKRTADLLQAASELQNLQNHDNEHSLNLSRGMKVDKKTFHFLMDAWAFCNEKDSPQQAMQLLQRMEELPSVLEPDVRSYTKTINAIARGVQPTAANDAERIFQRMPCAPNSFTYTALIQAQAYSGTPERANELLQSMIQRFERNPDRKDATVKPTAKAFTAVINAYGNAGKAEQAEYIFNQMEDLYARHNIQEAKPNAFHYNALISAWAKSSDAVRAGQVLKRMEQDKDIQPTTVSFNAVIDAFAKSNNGDYDMAQKAEELLRTMLDATNDRPRPNTRSFNSVMNAWAKSRHPDAAAKAESLLDLMEKLYADGDKQVRPDVHSFCTVINAWARSIKQDKAERAFNLYKDMEKMYKAGNKNVRPNVVAVNAVMNACAYTRAVDIRESNRAVEIAHTILKHLESQKPLYGKPDQITYGTFLKVCAHQMPDSHSRQQVVEVLFKKCVQDGQVGNMVLQQFQQMASPETYQELIGRSIDDYTIKMEDLPKAWWCNVVEGKWRRRRAYGVSFEND